MSKIVIREEKGMITAKCSKCKAELNTDSHIKVKEWCEKHKCKENEKGGEK